MGKGQGADEYVLWFSMAKQNNRLLAESDLSAVELLEVVVASLEARSSRLTGSGLSYTTSSSHPHFSFPSYLRGITAASSSPALFRKL